MGVRSCSMDRHETLASELLRALRGKRSQTAFSRRLGYRCNVAYTWESGRRFPSASVFLEAAERVGIDLAAAYTRFFQVSRPFMKDGGLSAPPQVAALLQDFRGSLTVTEVAKRARRHRVSVSRWLGGQAQPRLPELLLLVDVMTGRLLDFVALFASPALLPSTARAARDAEAQRRLAVEHPTSHLVLRALELSAYRALPRHEPGLIARWVGISPAEESRCLDLLRKAGQVRRSHGKWRVARVLTVDTPRSQLALKQHWLETTLERLKRRDWQSHGAEEALFSYNLFAVSEADLERIRELHKRYFSEIRAIVSDSLPSERVVLVTVNLLPLDTT